MDSDVSAKHRSSSRERIVHEDLKQDVVEKSRPKDNSYTAKILLIYYLACSG